MCKILLMVIKKYIYTFEILKNFVFKKQKHEQIEIVRV
jgi:hypothetical protein